MEDVGNINQPEGIPVSGTPEKTSIPESQQAKIETKISAEPDSNIKVTLIIDYVFWVTVAIILLRFAFKLIGASDQNAFVGLIYNSTNALVGVFQGIVSDAISGPMVVEFSSLITIVILWLIYKGILRLIAITK